MIPKQVASIMKGGNGNGEITSPRAFCLISRLGQLIITLPGEDAPTDQVRFRQGGHCA